MVSISSGQTKWDRSMCENSQENGRSDMPDVVYNSHEHSGMVVFAKPSEALRVHAINEALERATTWGEFKQLMPAEDYLEVIAAVARWRDELDGDHWSPRETDPFTSEQVPGFEEGDYPLWLQPRIDGVLPMDILEQFGELESSPNGSFWLIDGSQTEEITKMLETHGLSVEDWSHLNFF